MTQKAAAPEVLETRRLILRPLVASDAPGLHSCYGDSEAMQYWDFPALRDLTATIAVVAESLAMDPRWHRGWAVLVKETQEFAGYVNYHHRQPWHRRLEVGYILARPYWRRGLMTEAMRAFVGFCVDALETHRIEAAIEPSNVASIRLAERLGFRREGILRDRILVGGSYRSVVMFSLLADE